MSHPRGQGLFLQASDGQYPAPQGQLPGHRHAGLYLFAGYGRQHGRRHGDSGGRPVFGNGSLRNVEMDIMGLEEILVHPVGRSDRTHISQRDLGRFLHDVAHLAGHLKLPVSRHDIDFDLQRIAADAGPRQSPDDAHLVLLVGVLKGNLLFPQIFLQAGFRHPNRRTLFLQKLSGRLPADLPDPPLQVPDAGLPGIVVDDLFQRLVADGQLLACQAVPFQLLGHQIFFRDMELFILRIAGNLDQLHPVQ